jgi:hypothetical protein
LKKSLVMFALLVLFLAFPHVGKTYKGQSVSNENGIEENKKCINSH